MTKRYAVTIDFYIYADSDAQAIEDAEKFAKDQDKQNDDRCNVISIHRAGIGSDIIKIQ